MANRIVVIIAVVIVAIIIYSELMRRKEAPIFIGESGNYNARTIPPFGIWISQKERGNSELLEHEKVHWKQFQERGIVGFYWDYFSGFKNGYDNHPMEIEARSNESEFCKENYTHCVRNGLASTVENKKFRS